MNDTLRPLYHFTAPQGWLNDPNGLIYHAGLWHLFYQHNPHATTWGNMTWGHAVSRDLVRWEHWPAALEPYDDGTIFSGSAVEHQGVIYAFYTFAGTPFDQRLALSHDGARTFVPWSANPVVPALAGENRDPRVFWYAPGAHWCMALYVRRDESDGIEFFTSANLTDWTFTSRIEGFFECPECFSLDDRWVLFGADGEYVLGSFDGRTFTPETEKQALDAGAHFYAAQTWTDAPQNRRVLIAWMRGGAYPEQSFNQQMTFPTELTLQEHDGVARLCRQPVRELEAAWKDTWRAEEGTLTADASLTCPHEGEAFDIELALTLTEEAQFELVVRGAPVAYEALASRLTCLERAVALPPRSGTLTLRVLCDRTSLEVFGGVGEANLSSCFLPIPLAQSVVLRVLAGSVTLQRLEVRRL